MGNPEYWLRLWELGLFLSWIEEPLKALLREEWLVGISLFHLGLMLMMGGKLLKNEIQEHN